MAIETQNLTKGPFSVKQEGNSNTQGHHGFTRETYNNGDICSRSDNASQNFYSVPLQEITKDDAVYDRYGNESTNVSGLTERVTNSQYIIVGNSDLYNKGYQELADKKQLEIVAMRSQPEQIPDTSIINNAANMVAPPSNLLNCIKMPSAVDLQNEMDKADPVNGNKSLLGFLAMLKRCSSETAKEIATIQANYIKDAASKNYETKVKMYNKLPESSQEAYKQSAGATLFADNNIENASQLLNNPSMINAMLTPPSTANSTMSQNFDNKEYEKRAMDVLTKNGGIMEIERLC